MITITSPDITPPHVDEVISGHHALYNIAEDWSKQKSFWADGRESIIVHIKVVGEPGHNEGTWRYIVYREMVPQFTVKLLAQKADR